MIRIVLSHVARSREGAGLLDFADPAFVGELREVAAPLVADRSSWHVPPAKTLFVRRKISGIALLCVRMRARLPVYALAARHAEGNSATTLAGDPHTIDREDVT